MQGVNTDEDEGQHEVVHEAADEVLVGDVFVELDAVEAGLVGLRLGLGYEGLGQLVAGLLHYYNYN